MPAAPINHHSPLPSDVTDELPVLHRLSSAALHDLTISEMAALALDEVMAVIIPDHTFLFEAIDGGLVLQGVRPRDLELTTKKEIVKCLCDLAARERQPLYSMDLHTDARCTADGCRDDDILAFAALPLLVHDELIGVLGLSATRRREFGQEGRFLAAMAATIALIIKKARTCHDLRERAVELEGRIADCTAELAIRSNELERLNRIFVDREFRIKELRERVKALEGGDAVHGH